MSRATKPDSSIPPTVRGTVKYGGEYAIVEKCPFCGGRHFVQLEPGLQRANCDTWHPRAKAGFLVTFDEPTK